MFSILKGLFRSSGEGGGGSASTVPVHDEIGEGVALSRDLKFFDITMIGVGAMIGAGIFVLTGIAAGVAGPALVLAFFLNGVVTTFTAMSYAELGSAFPEAGGGYLWVKEALGGAQGFLSGWMSWFAHAVAGSLYALAFGTFAVEAWHSIAGLPLIEADVLWMTGEKFMELGFMTFIAILFTYINFLGSSEAGLVGNVITLSKVVILIIFVIFGLGVLFGDPNWSAVYTVNFIPNGTGGIVVAMGLTFIAFEGYEIIAQSGEEVIDPKRNIPRAIFTSIIIVVIIYVAVAFVAIGATQVPPEFGDIPVWEYLALEKETAIVRSAEQIIGPFGGLLILVSALASTMSALNATTFSSARVSFAMGRASNLPKLFGYIDPKRKTPVWAVVFSGMLIILMAWLLPIEAVAAAADIMFLFLFIQVNLSVMILRNKMPELDRGFMIPGFPIVPIIGILTQIGLLGFLFSYDAGAFGMAMLWIIGGLLLYFGVFSRVEEMDTPSDILLEETLVSTNYSVMVPVSTQEQARILGKIGAMIAKDNKGGVFALNVARVPKTLSLADGRVFLKEARPYLETVIEQAHDMEVPVHTMIRLGRDVADAIRQTVLEDASDLIVFGWPGYTNSAGRLFGSVIDPLIDNPPADLALVRYRKERTVKSILIPVSSGPNSRRAVKLALSMSHYEEKPSQIHIISVIPKDAPQNVRVRAEQAISMAQDGAGVHKHISTELIEGENIVDAILDTAKKQNHDMIVMGATEEPLFRNLLTGSLAAQVADQSDLTVMIVKRRSPMIHRMIRQTVLSPSTGLAATGDAPIEIEALKKNGNGSR